MLRIEPGLAEAIRSWTASVIEGCQPRLCCEVEIKLEMAVDLALSVLRTWSADMLFARVTSGEEFLVSCPELPRLLREEFEKDGSVSVAKIDTIGGCLFDFSLPETEGEEQGELLVAGWGDVEESVLEIAKREPTAKVFRGN